MCVCSLHSLSGVKCWTLGDPTSIDTLSIDASNAPLVNVLVFTGYGRGRGSFKEMQGGTVTLESLHFIYVFVSV